MIHFLKNSAVFLSQTRQFLSRFFGENILKSQHRSLVIDFIFYQTQRLKIKGQWFQEISA
jgi:hypothetical protein